MGNEKDMEKLPLRLRELFIKGFGKKGENMVEEKRIISMVVFISDFSKMGNGKEKV